MKMRQSDVCFCMKVCKSFFLYLCLVDSGILGFTELDADWSIDRVAC